MINFSVIIPCFNEEKNLPILIERFEKIIKTNDIELLLVENGSTDNSKKVLEKLLENHKFARKIDVPINKGYGYGIKKGLEEAKGKYIGFTHADLQTDPKDILKAIEIIKNNEFNNNIFIKGKRKGRPLFDNLFTFGMSIFETILLRQKLWDINAQPTFFHIDFYKTLKHLPNDFSLDLYLLYSAKINKNNIFRFKVLFPRRINGVSSWNNGIKSKLKFIKRTITYSFKLKKILNGSNLP